MSFLVHDKVGWGPSIESILVSARSMYTAGHLEGTSAQQGLVAGSGMSAHSTTIGEDQLIALSQRAPPEGQSACLCLHPHPHPYGDLDYIASSLCFTTEMC